MILNKGDKIEIEPFKQKGYFQDYIGLSQGDTTNLAGITSNLGEWLYVIYTNEKGKIHYTHAENVTKVLEDN